jgi:hypothetical protein
MRMKAPPTCPVLFEQLVAGAAHSGNLCWSGMLLGTLAAAQLGAAPQQLLKN